MIAPTDGGYMIGNDIYLGTETPAASVVLRTSKGEAMRYGVESPFTIDFPGEYEHDGVVIRCREAGEQLHYLVRLPSGDSLALLMNPKSVDHDALKSASHYYCVDDETKDRIEQNEFAGKISLLDEAAND